MFSWIDLPHIGDAAHGFLTIFEGNKNVPFDIRRVYCLSKAQADVPRGFHAHKKLNQLAVCLSGRCRMVFDDGKDRRSEWLDSLSHGLLIPHMMWHEMHDFSPDCILLVFASEYYDESDYIRSFSDFKNILGDGNEVLT